jgi:hypothetical protein
METLFLVTIFFINGQASFHPELLPRPQLSLEQCLSTVEVMESHTFELPYGIVLEGFYCMTFKETVARMDLLRSGDTEA